MLPSPSSRKKRKSGKSGAHVKVRRGLWLADEIVENILGYLLMDPDQEGDMHDYYRRIETLSALCRLSSQLYRMTMPHLWRRVCLDTLSWSGIKLFLRSVLLHPHCAELVTDLRVKTLPRDQTRHHRGLHHSRRKAYVQLCLKAIRTSTFNQRFKRQLEVAVSAQHWFADMSAPATHATRQWYVDAELVLILAACKRIERLEIDISPAAFKQHIHSARGAGTLMRLTTHFVLQMAIQRPIDGPLSNMRHIGITQNEENPQQLFCTLELAKILSSSGVVSCQLSGLDIDVPDDPFVDKVPTMREFTLRNVALERHSLSMLSSIYPNLTMLEVEITDTWSSLDHDMQYFGECLRNEWPRLEKLYIRGLRSWRNSNLIGNLQGMNDLTHLALPFSSFFDGQPPHPQMIDMTLVSNLPACLEYLHLYTGGRVGSAWLEMGVMALAASRATHPNLHHVQLDIALNCDKDEWGTSPMLQEWSIDTFEHSRKPFGRSVTIDTSIVLHRNMPIVHAASE